MRFTKISFALLLPVMLGLGFLLGRWKTSEHPQTQITTEKQKLVEVPGKPAPLSVDAACKKGKALMKKACDGSEFTACEWLRDHPDNYKTEQYAEEQIFSLCFKGHDFKACEWVSRNTQERHKAWLEVKKICLSYKITEACRFIAIYDDDEEKWKPTDQNQLMSTTRTLCYNDNNAKACKMLGPHLNGRIGSLCIKKQNVDACEIKYADLNLNHTRDSLIADKIRVSMYPLCFGRHNSNACVFLYKKFSDQTAYERNSTYCTKSHDADACLYLQQVGSIPQVIEALGILQSLCENENNAKACATVANSYLKACYMPQ